MDLDDRKLRIETRLLDSLEVDLDPQASQRLDLNLKISQEEVFSSRDNLVCEPEPWLTADLRMLGGCKLHLCVRRGYKRKTRQKRRTGLKARGRIWDVIEICASPLPPLDPPRAARRPGTDPDSIRSPTSVAANASGHGPRSHSTLRRGGNVSSRAAGP